MNDTENTAITNEEFVPENNDLKLADSENEQTDPAERLTLPRTVCEVDGVYVRQEAKFAEVISNFVLRPVERIDGGADWSELTVSIIPQEGAATQLTCDIYSFSTLSKFKAALDRIGFHLSFSGRQRDLEKIKLLLEEHPYERKRGVSHTGMYLDGPTPAFVSQDAAINSAGEKCSDWVMQKDALNVRANLLEFAPITMEELKIISKALFSFNELPVTATMLGFVGSCYLRQPLKVTGNKQGSLIIVGEAGGGKSTSVEQVIQPVFACGDAVSSSEITEATLRHAASSTNTVPLIIEEYKPARLNRNINDAICNSIRSSYDGHISQRGNGSRKVTERPLLAPIIIVGEAAPSEPAVRERSLQVLFAKNNLDQHPEYAANMAVLRKHQQLLSKLGRSLLHEAMNFDIAELKAAHTFLMANVPEAVGRWPERIRTNYVNAILGLELLDRVCVRLGSSLETMIGRTEQELEEALETGIREYLLDGKNHSLSVVEEALIVMFSRMRLLEVKDYKYLNAGSEIALNVTGVYDRYTKYVRQNKIGSETLLLDQFVQQLKKQSYFKENRSVRMGVKSSRTLVFDVAGMQQRLGEVLPARSGNKMKIA